MHPYFLIQRKGFSVHKRAREHRRLVRLEKAIRKWKRNKKPCTVQFKGEFEWIWEGEIKPFYLPDFPVDSKGIRKIIKEM